MNDALTRMVDNLPRAMFDKSPGEVLALRVRNPAGLAWEVSDSKLKLIAGGKLVPFDGTASWNGLYDFGETIREYTLADKTIAELADEIRTDGHVVEYESIDIGSRSALSLLPGANDQDNSNGDHLYAYTSILWSIMASYGGEIDEAKAQIPEAIKQMTISGAGGEWLDVWATLYGVPRQAGEADAVLRDRLAAEVFRLRVNPHGIEKAVEDLTGEQVSIDEPWRRMFSVSESALSGDHRMPDGEYYTYHVMQPVGVPGTDMTKVMPVIARNKPAGVDIFAARIDFPPFEVSMLPGEVVAGVSRGEYRGAGVDQSNNQTLGVLRFDADEGATINHLLAQHWLWVLAQIPEYLYDKDGGYNQATDSGHFGFRLRQFIQRPREVAAASVCLSDGVVLGDENGVLSRGIEYKDMAPAMSLSGTGLLSATRAVSVTQRVEQVSIDASIEAVDCSFSVSGDVANVEVRAAANASGFDFTYGGTVANQGAFSVSIELGGMDLTFDGSAVHDGKYQAYGAKAF